MSLPYLITLTLPTGNTYELRDQGARDLIQELMNFNEWLGVTTSPVDDGSTTNPVLINGEEVTATAGDVVSRDSDSKDFIFSSTGVWQNFGNLSGLGALAFKNSASGDYTPAGTVAAPTFTGEATTSTGSYIPAGSVSTIKQFKTQGEMPTYTVTEHNLIITAGTLPTGEDVTPTFTGTAATISVTGTPLGSNSAPAFTGTQATITVS